MELSAGRQRVSSVDYLQIRQGRVFDYACVGNHLTKLSFVLYRPLGVFYSVFVFY